MPREGIGRFAGKNEFSDVEFLEIFKELLPHVAHFTGATHLCDKTNWCSII